jgi:hypothetical protein
MPLDELARMVYGAMHFFYRVATLCITVGLFLFIVVIFKGSPDVGVIPFRLILAGFGLIFWDNSKWKELNRLYAVAFLVGAFLPTRYFQTLYAYLK